MNYDMKYFFRIGLFFLSTLIVFLSDAQSSQTLSSSDIYLQLKKLNVLGSVLYIAAHPDDENTRLLAYFAKEKQYRTGYLSLTRGDGGQNLIGDEQGIELGLIRTQELLAARKIDGAEQFFSRAFDFGFCKTATEALKTWYHDKILSDAVWVIRNFQPDVIITRFPPDARAGHGHHAASAIIAEEAFYAAADATKFPEQLLLGVQVWQAKRLLWNTFNFGGTNTTDSTQFTLDISAFNPFLGKGYGELSAESRSQHRSQGMGSLKQRGKSVEFFKRTAGDSLQVDLMDGVKTNWQRMNEENVLQQSINHIIHQYNFEHPEFSLDSLVALYKSIQRLNHQGKWCQTKLAAIKDLIIQCSGIFLEATTNNEYAVLGDSIQVNLSVIKRSNSNLQLTGISLDAFDTSIRAIIPINQTTGFIKKIAVQDTKGVTQPYWLVKPFNGGSFEIDDTLMTGSAENNAAFTARFTFDIGGIQLNVYRPVQFKTVDPVKGELYQPLVITKPVTLSLSPTVLLTHVKPGNTLTAHPQVAIQFKTNFSQNQLPVTLVLKQGTTNIFTKDTLIDALQGKVFNMSVAIENLVDKKLDNHITAELHVQFNGHTNTYSYFLRSIKYDHIPNVHYFYRDVVKLVPDEIKTVGKKIGYIMGAGDKVPQSLVQMGYEVKLLNEGDVTTSNLKQFDAIITGVRAYDVNAWLAARYSTLMKYIQDGGNLITQYNRSEKIMNGSIPIGPYPFTISSERVTEELSNVHVLLPLNKALNYPNKITESDFEGWVQERSTYQAKQFDTHFTAPLGMHDTGESESNGSLIIAKYGKGNFVYSGLVFFRQLPAGVPGAYRLFANLIALNTK